VRWVLAGGGGEGAVSQPFRLCRAGADFGGFAVRAALSSRFWMAWNWPRISPETIGELSAGKLGSSIGVDIKQSLVCFPSPQFYARPPAQAGKRPMPAPPQEPRRGPARAALSARAEWCRAKDARMQTGACGRHPLRRDWS